MSWAEVNKINSNMSQPLDVSIPKIIKNLILGGYVWSMEAGQQTLSVPSGIETIFITASGAGGGGGGSACYLDSEGYYGGGSGGGGGRAQQQIINQKVSISSSDISVVIGAGGAAGISKDSPTIGTAGANGEQTTLFDIVLAGGTGGMPGNASPSRGGTGGSVGGGNGTAFTYMGTLNGGGGGNGGGMSYTPGNLHVTQPEAGKNGIVIITWGALRFDDVKATIQTAIDNGATHGSDED